MRQEASGLARSPAVHRLLCRRGRTHTPHLFTTPRSFPIIFNGQELYQVMSERCGPSVTSGPKDK